MEIENSIHVGMAQLKITSSGSQNLHTLGIGSCIVVYLYDDDHSFAGCVHILLPDSKAIQKENINLKKFADTAIPHLIESIELSGYPTDNLKAKFTGGAQMFPAETQNIGRQNSSAVEKILAGLKIPVENFSIGGDKGRSAFFNTRTKELKVVKVNEEECII